MPIKRYNGSSWDVVAGAGVQGPQGATGASATTVVTTKGDLLGYSTTAARLGVGSNDQVLTADSSAATGLKWATPASGLTYSGCLAGKNIGQTLTANAYTAITWNVESWDTDNYHNNSTNPSRFTVPAGKAGYYRLTWNLGIGSVSGDVYYHLRVNGTTRWNFSWDMNSPTNIMGSATLNMAVGDYAELFVYNINSIATAYAEEALLSFDYLGA